MEGVGRVHDKVGGKRNAHGGAAILLSTRGKYFSELGHMATLKWAGIVALIGVVIEVEDTMNLAGTCKAQESVPNQILGDLCSALDFVVVSFSSPFGKLLELFLGLSPNIPVLYL